MPPKTIINVLIIDLELTCFLLSSVQFPQLLEIWLTDLQSYYKLNEANELKTVMLFTCSDNKDDQIQIVYKYWK